jgi:hypothetical protein
MEAIEIVIELAEGNIISEADAIDNELMDHRNRAIEACNTLHDFAVNTLSD